MLFRAGSRLAHKWASPPNPVLQQLKKVLTENLAPVYLNVRNDVVAGPWNTDKNFYGIICSPKFEEKSRKEMHEMVDTILKGIGMEQNCRFSLEPPSRWDRLYRKKRWRWGLD
jgi:stress-induced morphogen